MKLPSFSPRNEAIFAIEECCRITIAGRRLQLTTASLARDGPASESAPQLRVDLRKHRRQLLGTVKRLISSGVKLGATGLLWKCDICASPDPAPPPARYSEP